MMTALRKRSTSLTVLLLAAVILAGCSSGPATAVRRLDQLEPRSRADAMRRQATADRNGTQVAGPVANGEARGVPPGATEVTPPRSPDRTYVRMKADTVSRREYVRSRFPGKNVVFPDEIPFGAQRAEYRIGVDDVLQVLVWGQPDLSLDLLVRRDGSISMPLAGNLKVVGLTIPELERTLAERLSSFVDQPSVVVNPKEINSLRIFIVGSIRRPDISIGPVRSAFILRGGNTLLEALSDVEFLPDADLAASYVSRNDVIIPVDLKALLKDGDLMQNLLLEPGDRVVVPGPLKHVSVLGEVRQPDRYRVNLDTTLMDALSIAKGVNVQTADLYMAYVARNKQVLPINLKRLLSMGDLSQNVLMEDGDVVYVPDIRDNRFFVLGEVFKPGVVSYTEPMDVVEAVAQAGGFLITAQRGQVVVVRGGIQSPQIYQVNALGMLEGRFGERFILQRRDIVYVPRTPIADWNVFVTQLLPTIQGASLIDLMLR
jgi:polysaccharide export outer membrane protein